MKVEQEPKYNAIVCDDGETRLINRRTGNIIPDDEPIFILRARDLNSLTTINHYYVKCLVEQHANYVMYRAFDFIKFKVKHPDIMRQPGSQHVNEVGSDG
jgi:hypothetical protein